MIENEWPHGWLYDRMFKGNYCYSLDTEAFVVTRMTSVVLSAIN